MMIVWLLAGAGGPDAKAGEAPAAAMTRPPPAAATAMAVAASALLTRDIDNSLARVVPGAVAGAGDLRTVGRRAETALKRR